jgi:hypothetical protein
MLEIITFLSHKVNKFINQSKNYVFFCFQKIYLLNTMHQRLLVKNLQFL